MSATRPQRILVADNNPNVREKLAGCLRARGHDVITAATGERAFLTRLLACGAFAREG